MELGGSFGILGGDGRQVALAESIASDGYAVYAYGFDDVCFSGGVIKSELTETVANSKIIILPLPVTTDGVHLKMNYSKEHVVLDDGFAKMLHGKQVFGGKMEKLFQTSKLWQDNTIYDFTQREEFAVKNAVPTAEGALSIAIREYPYTVSGSRCLVVGFGRIGKVLAWMLHGIGAMVTVSARKQSDLAWIHSYGYSAVRTEQAGEGMYDIIFNTVPHLVFNRSVLKNMPCHPLIIDLASLPGGVDRKTAQELKIPVIQALALPGKVAPKAAGEIIKETIFNMIKG